MEEELNNMNIIMTEVDIHLENKKKSRIFFLFLCIIYIFVYMTKSCFGAAMVNLVSEGVLTKSETGLIIASFYIVYAPLQIAGGVMADKYSPEKLIKMSLIGAVLVNLIIFVNHNYYVMLIVWTLNAVIQTPIWPSVFKIISSQLVRSDRKQMIFLTSFTSSVGLLLAYVVAAIIPSWEYNFLVSACALTVYVIVLHIFCKKLNSYMKPDRKEQPEKNVEINKIPSVRLFMISGFFLLLPGVLLRSMVEQGTKTLSPTMLMEMYSNISPSICNILNSLIVASGILGTLIIKLILFPRIIKSEASGIFIMLVLSIPCAIALRVVGTIPIAAAVFALCGISTTLTATHLLISYFNLHFVAYGKNGSAAGISNAVASLGIVLESYGFVRIAEKYSWNIVTTLWIIMLITAALFTAVAVPLSKSFNKKGVVNIVSEKEN